MLVVVDAAGCQDERDVLELVLAVGRRSPAPEPLARHLAQDVAAPRLEAPGDLVGGEGPSRPIEDRTLIEGRSLSRQPCCHPLPSPPLIPGASGGARRGVVDLVAMSAFAQPEVQRSRARSWRTNSPADVIGRRLQKFAP